MGSSIASMLTNANDAFQYLLACGLRHAMACITNMCVFLTLSYSLTFVVDQP